MSKIIIQYSIHTIKHRVYILSTKNRITIPQIKPKKKPKDYEIVNQQHIKCKYVNVFSLDVLVFNILDLVQTKGTAALICMSGDIVYT